MEFYEKLYQALKNDDIKEFKDCMDTNYCGSLRLGRFPVLSVMYLYNSKRLLHAYEKKFLKHNSWQDVGEPMEIAAKFRSVAGKCLRLYLNETVSPLEMLLLLDRNTKLKQVFKAAHITAPVKQRLKDIYYIRWGLEADFVRGKIVLQRRPLTRREKWAWVIRATCMVLCLAILTTTPFVVNAFAPFITDEFGVINVSKWSQIDFGSNKAYALKKDVTIPEDFYVSDMNCELRGNGHIITSVGDVIFGNINGSISNVVFNTNGSPIAEDIQATAKVDNVTINADVDVAVSEAIGFLANKNHGLIENVVVNVSGKLTAVVAEQTDEVESGEEAEEEPFNCGGIVAHNYMLTDKNHYFNLTNCVVNYNNFSLQGVSTVDAYFGGIVGTNDGFMQDCQTEGSIIANTFDVAGICAENNNWIGTSENHADISQSTDVIGWSPLVAGIALFNNFTLDQCTNSGDISSNSVAVIERVPADYELPCAHAAGIAYRSMNDTEIAYLQNCANNGAVTASATYINASAAGICYDSDGAILNCSNYGNINASGVDYVVAAGIVNLARMRNYRSRAGVVYQCINEGEIVAKSKNEVFVGGIASESCLETALCFSFGNLEAVGVECYVGGIVGFTMGVSAHFLYLTSVINCIADCDIKTTKLESNDSFAAVGGIVGFMQQWRVYTDDVNYTYMAGEVIANYFIGNIQVSNGSYVGAIIGGVGEGVYNESRDADDDKKYFRDNVYVGDCGAASAFGTAFDADGNYAPVEDIGAESALLEQILNDAKYQELIGMLSK